MQKQISKNEKETIYAALKLIENLYGCYTCYLYYK